MNDQASYVQQLIDKGDNEARANLDAYVAQTNLRLNQLDDLGTSVNQLAAEIPQIRDTVRTMRPARDESGNLIDNAANGGAADPANSSRPAGRLIINKLLQFIRLDYREWPTTNTDAGLQRVLRTCAKC